MNKFETTDLVVKALYTGRTCYGNDISELIGIDMGEEIKAWMNFDFTDCLYDIKFADTETVSGRVLKFREELTYDEIIAEGNAMSIYQEYKLGHALLLANQLIKAKAIETLGRGVTIFLKETCGDMRFVLNVYRSLSGHLNVAVDSVSLGKKDAGDAVLFGS